MQEILLESDWVYTTRKGFLKAMFRRHLKDEWKEHWGEEFRNWKR